MGLFDFFCKKARPDTNTTRSGPGTTRSGADKTHSGTYRGVQYVMRCDAASKACVIEFQDATGMFLDGGIEYMLGNMIIAGFNLTRDEFKLCEGLADGQSSPALDDLIGSLLLNAPKDRLCYAFQLDPMMGTRMPIQLITR